MKWDDVATVKTDQPINVALPDGKTMKANIETQNGQIQAGSQTVAPKDVVTLRNDSEQKIYERYLHPGLLDLWTAERPSVRAWWGHVQRWPSFLAGIARPMLALEKSEMAKHGPSIRPELAEALARLRASS